MHWRWPMQPLSSLNTTQATRDFLPTVHNQREKGSSATLTGFASAVLVSSASKEAERYADWHYLEIQNKLLTFCWASRANPLFAALRSLILSDSLTRSQKSETCGSDGSVYASAPKASGWRGWYKTLARTPDGNDSFSVTSVQRRFLLAGCWV